MKELKVCEICKTKNEFVRFEGSFEGFICDECLSEINQEERIKDNIFKIELKGGIKENGTNTSFK